MLESLFKKRGRPAQCKRYCFQCARPKDSSPNRWEWIRADEVTINGERAFKNRTRPSRPIVCDRCGQSVNHFYEVRPDKPPLSVIEIEAQEHDEWIAFVAGLGVGYLAGAATVLLFLEGIRGLVAMFAGWFW